MILIIPASDFRDLVNLNFPVAPGHGKNAEWDQGADKKSLNELNAGIYSFIDIDLRHACSQGKAMCVTLSLIEMSTHASIAPVELAHDLPHNIRAKWAAKERDWVQMHDSQLGRVNCHIMGLFHLQHTEKKNPINYSFTFNIAYSTGRAKSKRSTPLMEPRDSQPN